MELQKAVPEDFDRFKEFYIDVIDRTESMGNCCRWVYGLHPTDALIRDYLDAGYLYYYEKDGQIAAAVAVAESQDEDYHGVPWQIDLADHEVATGHMMCVRPAFQRQGLARALLGDVCELSRRLGKKAYRFDALTTNGPAPALYDAFGFRRIAQRHRYARNPGRADFILYEKVL